MNIGGNSFLEDAGQIPPAHPSSGFTMPDIKIHNIFLPESSEGPDGASPIAS